VVVAKFIRHPITGIKAFYQNNGIQSGGKKPPQHILVFSTFCGPRPTGLPAPRGLRGPYLRHCSGVKTPTFNETACENASRIRESIWRILSTAKYRAILEHCNLKVGLNWRGTGEESKRKKETKKGTKDVTKREGKDGIHVSVDNKPKKS
jgi:hypothetical protein